MDENVDAAENLLREIYEVNIEKLREQIHDLYNKTHYLRLRKDRIIEDLNTEFARGVWDYPSGCNSGKRDFLEQNNLDGYLGTKSYQITFTISLPEYYDDWEFDDPTLELYGINNYDVEDIDIHEC